MQELFASVLRASLWGSVVILAVMLLRLVLKKAPKSVFCLLWLLAALRLILPFEIESPLSLQPAMTPVRQSVTVTQAVPEPSVIPEALPNNESVNPLPSQPSSATAQATQLPPVTLPQSQLQPEPAAPVWDWSEIIPYLWLAGVLGMIAAGIVSFVRLHRRVREAWLTEDGCRECPGIETAFVMGFFSPRIYIPSGLTDEQRSFILAHENAHIARWDHWWKLLMYTALALHWFNPLVWAAYLLLCRDLEMACDEQVVRHMNLEQRKAYSTTLLSCSAKWHPIAACPVAFGETDVKGRIQNVLNFKKPKFWIVLAACIAVVFVAVCLMTSPAAGNLLNAFSIPAGEISEGLLTVENRILILSGEEELEELTDILRSVSCDPDGQVAVPGDNPSLSLAITCRSSEKPIVLYFPADCALVWAEGDTAAYPVSNPEALRKYFAAVSEGVRDRKTTGLPFATPEEPCAWLQGITADAISKAEIVTRSETVREGNTSTTSSSSGIFAARELENLLTILNDLPETAVTTRDTLPLAGFGTLKGYLNGNDGMSVTLYDDVNQMVVMLRLLEGETIQLIFIDELDKVADGNVYLNQPPCWILEDETLLNCLRRLRENPPIIIYGWSEEELLLRQCRLALENFQHQECWAIRIDRAFNGNSLNSGSTQYYYGWGEDWLGYSMVNTGDFCDESWYLCKNGQRSSRYLCTNVHPENGEGTDTGWVRGFQLGEGQVALPWLKTFQWQDADITLLENRTEGDYQMITITVQGSPSENGIANVSQYQVTFLFDGEKKLCQVLKNYTQTQEVVSNGEKTIGITQVSTTIQLLDDTKEEIVDTIVTYAKDAAQDLQASENTVIVCTDPNCTNPEHNHHSTACTIPNCTDESHNHSHSDHHDHH